MKLQFSFIQFSFSRLCLPTCQIFFQWQLVTAVHFQLNAWLEIFSEFYQQPLWRTLILDGWCKVVEHPFWRSSTHFITRYIQVSTEKKSPQSTNAFSPKKETILTSSVNHGARPCEVSVVVFHDQFSRTCFFFQKYVQTIECGKKTGALEFLVWTVLFLSQPEHLLLSNFAFVLESSSSWASFYWIKPWNCLSFNPKVRKILALAA